MRRTRSSTSPFNRTLISSGGASAPRLTSRTSKGWPATACASEEARMQPGSGQVLTEGPAIVQYLADQKPDARLAPKSGSFERHQLQEWLNFIGTELHKGFSPLFKPNTPDEYKRISRENLSSRIEWLDKQLHGKDYLMGKTFGVADAYAVTVLSWTKPLQFGLSRWPNVTAHLARGGARPKVQEALRTEGLLKQAA